MHLLGTQTTIWGVIQMAPGDTTVGSTPNGWENSEGLGLHPPTKDAAIAMLTSVHALLSRIKETTSQLTQAERWRAIVKYIIEQIMACKPQNPVICLPTASR